MSQVHKAASSNALCEWDTRRRRMAVRALCIARSANDRRATNMPASRDVNVWNCWSHHNLHQRINPGDLTHLADGVPGHARRRRA
jgi:hypothetical protein